MKVGTNYEKGVRRRLSALGAGRKMAGWMQHGGDATGG
jgi:hypothetical protein